jgi:hypothetical protein
MQRLTFQPEIMQRSAGGKYLMHAIVPPKPAFVFNNAVALDAASGMLYPYPLFFYRAHARQRSG